MCVVIRTPTQCQTQIFSNLFRKAPEQRTERLFKHKAPPELKEQHVQPEGDWDVE